MDSDFRNLDKGRYSSCGRRDTGQACAIPRFSHYRVPAFLSMGGSPRKIYQATKAALLAKQQGPGQIPWSGGAGLGPGPPAASGRR